jgi:hypothetical protein
MIQNIDHTINSKIRIRLVNRNKTIAASGPTKYVCAGEQRHGGSCYVIGIWKAVRHNIGCI